MVELWKLNETSRPLMLDILCLYSLILLHFSYTPLGGKAPSDPKEWSPDMKAVWATIKYAIATGRLNLDDEQGQRLDQSQ
jgi:hypothetical protein